MVLPGILFSMDLEPSMLRKRRKPVTTARGASQMTSALSGPTSVKRTFVGASGPAQRGKNEKKITFKMGFLKMIPVLFGNIHDGTH